MKRISREKLRRTGCAATVHPADLTDRQRRQMAVSVPPPVELHRPTIAPRQRAGDQDTVKNITMFRSFAEELKAGLIYVEVELLNATTGSSETRLYDGPAQDNSGHPVLLGHCGGYNNCITTAFGLVRIVSIKDYTERGTGRKKSHIAVEPVEWNSAQAQEWADANGYRIRSAAGRIFAEKSDA